jgi:hypothetical protein
MPWDRAMLDRIATAFTHHPRSVGESYGQHFTMALGYAGKLLLAGLCALVHAILPFLFEKTASTIIRAMHADLERRTKEGHHRTLEPHARITPAE